MDNSGRGDLLPVPRQDVHRRLLPQLLAGAERKAVAHVLGGQANDGKLHPACAPCIIPSNQGSALRESTIA